MLRLLLLSGLLWLLALGASGCHPQGRTDMQDAHFQTALTQHYQRPIQVKEVHRSQGKYRYVVSAVADTEPPVSFVARFDQAGQLQQANLRQMWWSQQLQAQVEPILAQAQLPFVSRVVYYQLSGAEDLSAAALPSLSEWLREGAGENKADIHVHYFATADDQADEHAMLQAIRALAAQVQAQSITTLYVHASVYDRSAVQEQDLTQHTFGFQQIEPGDFEATYRDHLQKRLVFELRAEQPLPDLARLAEVMDRSPSYFGSPVQRF